MLVDNRGHLVPFFKTKIAGVLCWSTTGVALYRSDDVLVKSVLNFYINDEPEGKFLYTVSWCFAPVSLHRDSKVVLYFSDLHSGRKWPLA